MAVCADPVVAELGNSQRSVTGEPESFGRIIDPEALLALSTMFLHPARL